MSPRDHACDACGGTGDHDCAQNREPFAARCYVPCSVCSGVGRISDRMPAADALADAETLCNVAQELAMAGKAFASRVMNARNEAVRIARSLDGAPAARAAFRAVPGLRGE